LHTYSNKYDTYDVQKLWKSAPKTKWVSIKKLEHCLKENIWGNKTPKQHLKDKGGPEWDTMLESDLRYAIIVTPDMDVADGNHRLMKAKLLNKKRIRARVFESYCDMMPAEIDK